MDLLKSFELKDIQKLKAEYYYCEHRVNEISKKLDKGDFADQQERADLESEKKETLAYIDSLRKYFNKTA